MTEPAADEAGHEAITTLPANVETSVTLLALLAGGLATIALCKFWGNVKGETMSSSASSGQSQEPAHSTSGRERIPSVSDTDLGNTDYLKRIWEQTLAELENELGTADYKLIKTFPSFNDFVAAVREKLIAAQDSTTFSLVTRLEPGLNCLRNFSAILAASQIRENVNTAALWGLFYALIDVTQKSVDRLNAIIDMLDEISTDLEIFDTYKHIFESEGNSNLEETLVMAMIDVVKFWAQIIKHIRRTPIMRLGLKITFEDTLKATRARLQRQTKRISARAQVLLLRQMDRIGTMNQLQKLESLRLLESEAAPSFSGSANSDNSSAVDIPFSNLSIPRNLNFVGRELLLQELRERLDHRDDSPQLRSWLVHGMPGVGKTALATEYAHSRIEQGVEVVLWINAERPTDVDISFSTIAARMNLEGAEENGDHLKNKQLVMKWLQRTRHRWLVVFDNVEDPGLLSLSWPSGTHGSILVTSRIDMPYGPVEGSSRVNPFPTKEASKYLLKIVSRKEYDQDERDSAASLCEEVEGYPLHLNILGAKIKRLNKPVAKYLAQFRQNPSGTLKQGKSSINPHYPKSVATVWSEAFSHFEREENSHEVFALMGVLSCLAAQDIPVSFFELPGVGKGFPSLQFCSDNEEFDNALLPLLILSIVQRNNDSNNLLLHRVAQERFLEWLGKDRAFETFRSAVHVIKEAFPRQEKGMGLRNKWPECIKAAPHVLALGACYRRHRWQPVCPGDFDSFLELLRSCGWFLMERGSWKDFQELFVTADMVCDDKDSLAWAHMLNTASAVESEKGHAAIARRYIEKALEIRTRLLPPDDMDLSDVYNNFGFMLLNESNEPQTMLEAVKYFNMARELDEKHPNGSKVLHVRYLNMGKAYVVLGNYSEGERMYEIGKYYSERTYGKGTHFVGRYCYLLGDLRLKERKFDEAKRLLDQCLEIQTAENETHPIVSATRMKLAIIEMEVGKLDRAMLELEMAKVICEANAEAKGDLSDVARALWLLSEAHRKQGNLDEADRLHREAEFIRKEVQGPQYDQLPDTLESYELMVWAGYR